jgi:hypothetical protein
LAKNNLLIFVIISISIVFSLIINQAQAVKCSEASGDCRAGMGCGDQTGFGCGCTNYYDQMSCESQGMNNCEWWSCALESGGGGGCEAGEWNDTGHCCEEEEVTACGGGATRPRVISSS